MYVTPRVDILHVRGYPDMDENIMRRVNLIHILIPMTSLGFVQGKTLDIWQHNLQNCQGLFFGFHAEQ